MEMGWGEEESCLISNDLLGLEGGLGEGVDINEELLESLMLLLGEEGLVLGYDSLLVSLRLSSLLLQELENDLTSNFVNEVVVNGEKVKTLVGIGRLGLELSNNGEEFLDGFTNNGGLLLHNLNGGKGGSTNNTHQTETSSGLLRDLDTTLDGRDGVSSNGMSSRGRNGLGRHNRSGSLGSSSLGNRSSSSDEGHAEDEENNEELHF